VKFYTNIGYQTYLQNFFNVKIMSIHLQEKIQYIQDIAIRILWHYILQKKNYY